MAFRRSRRRRPIRVRRRRTISRRRSPRIGYRM